jgi:hypothetical protein
MVDRHTSEHAEPTVPSNSSRGWLSCDTVEARAGTTDATQLILRSISSLPGFATVRLEGNCAATDFKTDFVGAAGPFDESIARRVGDWFGRHR